MDRKIYIMIGLAITIAIGSGISFTFFVLNSGTGPISQSIGLEIEISVPKQTYSVSEQVIVDVKLSNKGANGIQILDLVILENYPYTFDIIDDAGNRVPFLGTEINLDFDDSFFSVLQPGDSIMKTVNLHVDDDGEARYDLNSIGSYNITATYWSPFEQTKIVSNSIQIKLE